MTIHSIIAERAPTRRSHDSHGYQCETRGLTARRVPLRPYLSPSLTPFEGYYQDVAAVVPSSLRPSKPPRCIASTVLADVVAEPVMWVWEGYLPVGKLVIVQGDPGVSKSTFSIDVAARISTGTPFPGQIAAAEAAPVLILSYEDSAADSIRPR